MSTPSGWYIESVSGWFLRSCFDGALAWTHDPSHALRFSNENDALAVIRKNLSGEVHAHWVTRFH